MKKSWQEKLRDSKDLPKVVKLTGGMKKRFGPGTIVIPAPIEVDELMRRVRKGRLTTIDHIRENIADKHQATTTCPMVSGIHASIAARAADEAEQEGKKRITPYWRTLRAGGQLNPKYPGGVENLKRRLTAEGHKVVHKGKKLVVVDYEKKLAKL